MGYEPVTVDVNVAPGTAQTVSLRLLRQRTLKPAAKANFESGDAIWKKSGASPADLVKAADFFSKALKDEPSYSQAALGLCRVQQAQGKPDEALKACQRAVQTDPDYVEARTMAGALLMETGDYPEAVRQAQQAALMDPKNSFVQSLLAEALFLADRPKESEEAANRALDLDPSSAQAFLLRGEARRAQMRYDEAIVDYDHALEAGEFGSGALRKVAFFAIGTGMTKHRSGVQFLYRSQKASAYFGLCAAEIGRQNYLHAIKFCNQSLGVEKDDPDSHLLLSECYAGMFSKDNRRDYLLGAKDNLEAVLRLNPNVDKGPQLRAKLKEITELLGVVR
jgi:tetratricopeptide (TPR) repeat protein